MKKLIVLFTILSSVSLFASYDQKNSNVVKAVSAAEKVQVDLELLLSLYEEEEVELASVCYVFNSFDSNLNKLDTSLMLLRKNETPKSLSQAVGIVSSVHTALSNTCKSNNLNSDLIKTTIEALTESHKAFVLISPVSRI